MTPGARPGLAHVLVLVLAAAALVRAPEARAQASRWSLELRGGAALPTGAFGEADADCPLRTDPDAPACPWPDRIGASAGVGLALRAAWAATPHLSLLAGYSRADFGCPPVFCGTAADPETSGVEGGLRIRAIRLGTLELWLEGSGSWERIRAVRTGGSSDPGDARRVDYRRSVGLGVGAGLTLPVTPRLSFVPAIRYRTFTAEPEAGAGDPDPREVRYFVLDAGLRFRP